MALKDILLLGNPLLYEISSPVKEIELDDLFPEIEDLLETILEFRKKYGVGRAITAPQIGLMKRIICVNIDKPVVMINPELTNLSNEMFEVWDDCMCFPGLLVKVLRHKNLTVSYFDMDWKKHSIQLHDDMAELIQHEYDHLDGILATQKAMDNQSFKIKTITESYIS
jgi:peptide deformylase